MIIDSTLEFADAVSVAGSTGTNLIGSQVDTSVVRDIGQGQPVYLVLTVATTIVTGGVAGTIAFQLASDAAAAIATDGTQSIHFVTDTFVTDDTGEELQAGEVIGVYMLPANMLHAYERYLGIQAVVATAATTAGAINAFLTIDPYGWKAYADATN